MKYRDVCDDYMFTLMLKQIYSIHELSKLSEDFVTSSNKSARGAKSKKSSIPVESKENPTTLPITERLRKSVLSRQKFFTPKE